MKNRPTNTSTSAEGKFSVAAESRPAQTESHHAVTKPSSVSKIPSFPQSGEKTVWLSRLRDRLQSSGIILCSFSQKSSRFTEAFSSDDSPAPKASKAIIEYVKAQIDPDPLLENPIYQWFEYKEKEEALIHLFVNLAPCSDREKTKMVIILFAEKPSLEISEALPITSAWIVSEARLTQETLRRSATEELFYHSQKLNCVGQLAGGIAHDFNNLLTVIQGHTAFVDMEAQKWNDPKVTESLDLIKSATSQSIDLVMQLLLFSRDQKANFEQVDPNKIVGDFAKMVRRMIEEHIEMRIELGEDIRPIKADKGMIGQILMNLVVNSRDAMPNGGEILIRTSMVHRSEKPNEQPFLSILISDTGTGISKLKLTKIFDPFYTTKKKGEGTGLGLANVATLVRQHQGIIDISSELGKGTEIEILFPTVAETKSKPPAAEPKPEGKVDHQSIRGSKVLLVEDESAVRKLVRKLLEMHGCSVIEAQSGKEALDIWPDICDEISVVVSDIIMPEGVSGWDLARHLHERHPNLGILLTSGYNERPEDHGFGNEPQIAFLQKPYESIKLKSNLFELIQSKPAV
ncbi:MAG: ATP-binding protein [Verrucomicrobiales bacterium]|nr:ATP-binding protein [Verrucomicrobiales bacterium]